MERFGKYSYMALGSHELAVKGKAGETRTSLAPSALGTEHKPWLADALPRRFRDGLPLPVGVVEGVTARQVAEVEEEALPESAPFTAPRRRQRTYDVPQAGGCLCGAIRFAVNAAREPRLVVACHCHSCQRSSGAPFLAWATLDADDYTLLHGSPAEYVQSGGVRRFCGACGTPLSFQRTDLAEELDVALHSFDSLDVWTVEMNIWTEHRREAIKVDHLPSWKQDPASLVGIRGVQDV